MNDELGRMKEECFMTSFLLIYDFAAAYYFQSVFVIIQLNISGRVSTQHLA